jgi:hypothetical protein
MTREYNWTIHSLETVSVVPDKPKLVTFIHCGLSATETLPDNSVMHDGVGGVLCVYGGNGDDIDNFTPYNQLTEEQVTSWLMTVTPQADRDAMKTKLDNIMDNRKLTSIEIPPWVLVNPVFDESKPT